MAFGRAQVIRGSALAQVVRGSASANAPVTNVTATP
jgi:hypothetical protein